MEKDENIISATSARTARGSLATRKDEEYIGDYIRERERERKKLNRAVQQRGNDFFSKGPDVSPPRVRMRLSTGRETKAERRERETSKSKASTSVVSYWRRFIRGYVLPSLRCCWIAWMVRRRLRGTQPTSKRGEEEREKEKRRREKRGEEEKDERNNRSADDDVGGGSESACTPSFRFISSETHWFARDCVRNGRSPAQHADETIKLASVAEGKKKKKEKTGRR